MKIVYISSAIIPSRTANSIHVMKMCQAFARNGHEVILIAPDKKIDIEPDISDNFAFYGVKKSFKIIKLPWLPLKGRTYIYGFLAARKAKQLSPDIVYCRHVAGCFFSIYLKLYAILESHSPIPDSSFVNGVMFRDIIKNKYLQKLIVITQALKKYYKNHYPEIKCEIQVAPDGADPVPDDIKAINLVGEMGYLKVGYIGHLYKGRGIELIEKLALKTTNFAEYYIVGGTQYDIENLQNRTKTINNFHILGYKKFNEAERIKMSCDILLAPYQKEVTVSGGSGDTVKWMSPLKIFEYMAVGKTIICSDLPALREVMFHEKNAILCHCDNCTEWETALRKLYKNESLRKKLGFQAYKDFEKHYTWSARAGLLV